MTAILLICTALCGTPNARFFGVTLSRAQCIEAAASHNAIMKCIPTPYSQRNNKDANIPNQ